MVSVTKKYQVTIPKEVREDLNINQGDKVVFIRDKEDKWVLMTVEELTNKMVESSEDIEKTVAESREGFETGVKTSIRSVNNENGD